MNMIQVMTGELADMRDERDRLKRENAILRKELKDYVVNHMVEVYDMSEEEAFEEAEKEITHMVLHNEGAE
jgi:TRAP-type C4-dicarboxylate transport system substrate-binding protein